MDRNTYVEINLNNIDENIKSIIQENDDYDYYIGVVKGSCYGHGSYLVNQLINSGINYLAVSSLKEAITVRKYNVDIPILCLEPINLKYIDDIINNNITLTVSSLNYLENLLNLNIKAKIKIHLKINTGMNRLGFKNKEEIKKAYDLIKNNILLEGIYTHLITTGISDPYYDNQINKFYDLTSLIDLDKIKIVHIGRSLTALNHPKIDKTNGIRLGIAMYGYNMIPKKNNSLKGKLKQIKANLRIRKYNISKTIEKSNLVLKPAFSLYSEVMELQNVNKGEFVGYGVSYKAPTDIKVAVLPIGYADGIPRSYTGSDVFINKKRYEIIGSVNMGMITVKVDEDVSIGDKVEFIGEKINIKNSAIKLNTTIYEVMCMIHENVPRVYKKDGKTVYIENWEVK